MSTLKVNESIEKQEKLQRDYNKCASLKLSVISHYQNEKYSIMNQASNSQTLIFQCLGTALFTFGFTSSVNPSQSDTQAAGCLFMAISFCSILTGANLNPIVSISNAIKNDNSYKSNKVGVYIIAQLLGAVLGLFLGQIMNGNILPQISIAPNISIFRVMMSEAMGVFIFIFFLLLLSNPNTTFIENELSAFASIAVFYFIARSYAGFAGLCINPAITLALVFQHFTLGQLESLKWFWVLIVGDFIGCSIAHLIYSYAYEPIIKQLRVIRRRAENQDNLFQSHTYIEDFSK